MISELLIYILGCMVLLHHTEHNSTINGGMRFWASVLWPGTVAGALIYAVYHRTRFGRWTTE